MIFRNTANWDSLEHKMYIMSQGNCIVNNSYCKILTLTPPSICTFIHELIFFSVCDHVSFGKIITTQLCCQENFKSQPCIKIVHAKSLYGK